MPGNREIATPAGNRVRHSVLKTPLLAGSSQFQEGVTAVLLGLVQSKFGAIDPLGHYVFPVVVHAVRRFGHNRAHGWRWTGPCGLYLGSDAPQFIADGSPLVKSRIGQNKSQ